jgi:hypothetical protein
VRGCCGWSRPSSGCAPASADGMCRRGRERRAPPQTPEPVTARLWEDLPEANRRVAVHWLAVMAGKAVRAVRAASGTDPSAGAGGES